MTKIPGEVWFSMDIRSEDNDVLLAIDRELRDDRGGDRRAARRDDRSRRLHQRACPARSTAGHRARLERLASELGIPALPMASGAGHDSAVFGTQGVPTAMIFMRNDHGSHNPDEAMDLADFAQGSAAGRRGGEIDAA